MARIIPPKAPWHPACFDSPIRLPSSLIRVCAGLILQQTFLVKMPAERLATTGART